MARDWEDQRHVSWIDPTPLTSSRFPPRRPWRRRHGAASAGGAGPKGCSRRASPRCASASPTGPSKDRRHRPAAHARRRDLLIGEHRSTGERKYYLSNLAADASLKTLAGAVKARWACEQAHQQIKEELGLDHFEGRSWTGLHRPALKAMIAYAFLQSRRLNQASGKKESPLGRLNPACPRSGRPSWIGSSSLRCTGVGTAGRFSRVIGQSSAS